MAGIHPELRAELLKEIEQTLYNKARLQLTRELYTLIAENSKLHENNALTLRFKGEIHSMVGTAKLDLRSINPLHRSLRERMQAWLAEREAIEDEKTLALGYVQRVMLASDCIADYQRLLPDALAPVLRKFARYFRSGEGRFTEAEALSFEQENEKYILQMKLRMTRNLLES